LVKERKMTNEEIRKRFETFVGLGGRILYDECDVYKLQDLTRADERRKVIGGIDGLIQTWAESEQNNSFPQDSLYWGGW